MADADFTITWVDRKRWPQDKPDPAFPEGVDIDLTQGGSPSCGSPLPYPAKRCGLFYVECRRCRANAVITTAGRVDDPRSVRIRCAVHG